MKISSFALTGMWTEANGPKTAATAQISRRNLVSCAALLPRRFVAPGRETGKICMAIGRLADKQVDNRKRCNILKNLEHCLVNFDPIAPYR